MIDSEWLSWVDHHSILFGLKSAEDEAMLLAWRDCFVASGFTGAELTEATNHLAQHNPPRWRSEHLAALTARIKQRRAERLRMERDEEESRASISGDYVACSLCGGSGVVAVPHLGNVNGGEWIAPWYTTAVACQCNRGERLHEGSAGKTRDGADRKLMRLQTYAMKNPHWQSQVIRRKDAVLTEAKAQAASKGADAVHGKMRVPFRERVAVLREPGCEEECPF